MAQKRRAPLTTKKHLARAERERIQRRWIIIGTIATAALVVGILAHGWIRIQYIEPGQPVAIVNGEKITTRQFRGQVGLMRLELITRYQNYQQLLAFFGADPSFQTQAQQQLDQIQSQLANTTSLGLTVLNQLIDDTLVRQEANRRGIVVTDAEVQQAVEASFRFYPSGTPTSQPTATISAASQTAQVASATEAAATATLEAPTNTPLPTATLGPSPTVTQTATPLPTATPYTREAFQADYQAEINRVSEATGASEADFRARYRAGLYQQKLLQAFEADVPREQDQVWARHILVDDEATAREVLNRLLGGEPWDALVAEFSKDTAAGPEGDLGWFTKGIMDPQFEAVAFATPVGETSKPVQSSFGWHIIQVLGHESRPLDDAQFQEAVRAEFSNWLAEQRNQGEIEIKDYWPERVPTEPGLSALAGTAP